MRAILPFVLLLVGCPASVRMAMKEKRDSAALATAASDYWTMVRWGEAARASAHLENPAQKLQLARLLGDPHVRITDASVLQVVVGDDLPAEQLPRKREGTAMVRIEAFDIRGGKVEVQTLEQHWVKVDFTWLVDAEKSPLGAERPW
jgi:hypothetical protein